MSKPYDATMKHLLDEFAADWVSWLAPIVGLPVAVDVEPLDVDLSSVQYSADKVFRLCPPGEGLLHIEPQSTWDGKLPERMMLYNGLLHERYLGPVYSVTLLLRRGADSPLLTGTLSRKYPDGREYLRFNYSIVRVWELSAESLLSGNIGAIPLSLLTDEATGRLGEFVDRIDDRLRSMGTDESTRKLILTSSYILLGMRYDEVVIDQAFIRTRGMKESTTYQAILREGRDEGRDEGVIAARKQAILDILAERFGVVTPEVQSRIQSANDASRLQFAVRQSMRIASPGDLEI